jgi:hypothetical protein
VEDVWRNFNIESVIHNIGDTWTEVLQSCMNGVLRNVSPDVVTDFHGFDLKRRLTVQGIPLLAFQDCLIWSM